MTIAIKPIAKSFLLMLCQYQSGRTLLQFVHRYVGGKDQWHRRHPYDQANGISTQGYLPGWLLGTGTMSDSLNSGYAGCQPSCLREGLSSVPNPEGFSYFDLGCGKGRSLAVAAEFPFREIIGIEIAPELGAVAKANADILRRRYPNRTPIKIIVADASRIPFPDGNLVVFLYHSFGKPLLELLIARLMALGDGREIFFVYENPVNGSVLDSTPSFIRWFAKTVVCDPTERGFAPDDSETIVVWRTGGNKAASPSSNADVPIGGTEWRALLQTDIVV